MTPHRWRLFLETSALAAAALCLVGCFREVQEETQLEGAGFLKFPDLAEGTEVRAEGDRSYRFVVGDPETSRYRIQPGTYRITVSDGQRTILDRRIFVAEGETRVLRAK